MSTSLRVSDDLYKEAEAEGSLMNRKAPNQLEFWAELGKRVAHSASPADLLALKQGIAEIRIEIAQPQSINAQEVFAEVDKRRSTRLGQQLTQNSLYYEASVSQPGLLDQVMPDGRRSTGRFTNGSFIAK